jgi:hypothetical protein
MLLVLKLDGSIAVTNSQGATVVTQANANNDVVANTGLVVEHILTATATGGNEGQTVLLLLK